MMPTITLITRFLNNELDIKRVKDSSKNGLQVKGKTNVNKIGFCVDACLESFKKAKKQGCDLVIVHHGLLWKGKEKYPDLKKKRIAYLKKNNLSLYAAHLPLDKHPVYGNNMQLARLFGLKEIKPFAKHNSQFIGYYGKLNKNANSFVKEVNKKLQTKSVAHMFGAKKTKVVGVVSGAAPEHVVDCHNLGIDTYLTGETSHLAYNVNKELKMNVIYAGHYKTEGIGLKAIMKLLNQKFKIQCVFIDNPTRL